MVTFLPKEEDPSSAQEDARLTAVGPQVDHEADGALAGRRRTGEEDESCRERIEVFFFGNGLRGAEGPINHRLRIFLPE